MINNRLILLTLEQVKGIGKKKLTELDTTDFTSVKYIDELFEIYKEIKSKNSRIETISIEQLKSMYYDIESRIKESEKKGIFLINFYETDFPQRLLKIRNKPAYIFYKGNKEALYVPGLAVIGTREASPFAEKIGERFGEVLAERKASVISGLALGCDAAAHRGCVKGNGVGVVILPAPLDKVTPVSNKKLAEDILQHNGCWMSEYIIGTQVDRYKFVERDRLQTALAKGVIVVETGKKGGSWHAINEALTYKKPIACFDFKPRYYEEHSNSLGNKLLIDEKKATGISNTESLKKFLDNTLDSDSSKVEIISLF